jgi:hypothetical protein
MKAHSGPQPNRMPTFFYRYRGKTGRSADIAKTTQMTQMRIANFHYAQQVDKKSRKIFQDFVLLGSRPKGIL